VRRQKLPKDDVGNHYSWKDLNIGVNVTAYGKVFHFYDCDKFTRVGPVLQLVIVCTHLTLVVCSRSDLGVHTTRTRVSHSFLVCSLLCSAVLSSSFRFVISAKKCCD